MKRLNAFALFSIIIVAAMFLAACGAAATTVAPATEAPATAVPATAAPAYVPMSLVAPNCDYGTADNPAKLKSIEAVDEYPVLS